MEMFLASLPMVYKFHKLFVVREDFLMLMTTPKEAHVYFQIIKTGLSLPYFVKFFFL